MFCSANLNKLNELIDTLWNVNSYYDDSVKGHMIELIDTLWNVNQYIAAIIKWFSQN